MRDAQETPAGVPEITPDAVETAPPPVPPPGPMPVPNPVPAPTPKPEPPPAPATESTPVPTTAPATAPEAGAGDAFKVAAEAEAAGALAAILKTQAGIVPELVTGATIAEVQAAYTASQAAYTQIKSQVLADLGAALPGGHASAGGGPVPSSPYDMIAAGIAAAGNK